MLPIPDTLPAEALPAARYLAAALLTLAREERAARRPTRLLEPNHATWARFRGRLGARDFAELLLEDAAVTQSEPFEATALLPSGSSIAAVPDGLVADWLALLPSADLAMPHRTWIDQRASALGIDGRPAASQLRKLQPHHRVLELPGSGGLIASAVAEAQEELFVQELFTIACGRWEERMLAGLVFVDRAVVGGARIALDPKLDRARKEEPAFSHVFGLRTDKGGSFEALELRGWFPSADIVLV